MAPALKADELKAWIEAARAAGEIAASPAVWVPVVGLSTAGALEFLSRRPDLGYRWGEGVGRFAFGVVEGLGGAVSEIVVEKVGQGAGTVVGGVLDGLAPATDPADDFLAGWVPFWGDSAHSQAKREAISRGDWGTYWRLLWEGK